MSAISLRIPNSLRKHMGEIAKHDGVSVNQFISVAISEKVSALNTHDYLLERTRLGSRAKFEKALSRIPNSAPDSFDKL